MTEAGHETASSKGLRILLVASFALVRIALKQILSTSGEVSIVGDADPGAHALNLAGRKSPDIAIIDTPHMDQHLMGFVGSLLAVAPDIRPIILSDGNLEQGAIQAFRVGAWAYLPRDLSQVELMRAIRQVSQGKVVLGCALEPQQWLRLKEMGLSHTPLESPLSQREEMVVRAMASGDTDSEIARNLGVAVPTVKTHVRSILRKTNSRNRTAAIATAFRVGVLS